MTERTDAFLKFVATARELLSQADDAKTSTHRQTRPPVPSGDEEALLDRWTTFLAAARPLATAAARAYLKWFEVDAVRVRRSLFSDDLILVAGHRHVENSYTRLAAWALGFENASPIAQAVQRRWLARLLPALVLSGSLRVIPQLQTDGGVPDLILVSDELLVVVEAKTLTTEHEAAQTGRHQTEAYLDATRDTLSIDANVAGAMVFLTMNGDVAVNEAAVTATFTELALVILEVLDDYPSAEAAWPYRSLASHWLLHATPGVSITDVSALSAKVVDDGALLRELPQILRLERLVPMRGNPR